jgi:formate-dependent nitrite reductase membrane component NrfD
MQNGKTQFQKKKKKEVVKMAELAWGIILAGYLFLGGLAGGSYIVGGLVDLFKEDKEEYRVLAKSSILVSFIAILIGLVILVLDLKRFAVDPLVILNVYRRFGSIMTVGTWIITLFIAVSLVTVLLLYLDGDILVRKLVEIVGIILGLSTTAYTGLLLAFSRGAPLWNTGLLPWTFVISGVLTGLAVSIFMIPIASIFFPRIFEEFKTLWDQSQRLANFMNWSQKYIIILICIELVLVVLELIMGQPHSAILLSLEGISLVFYTYLILGLILPLGISVYTRSSSEKTIIYSALGSYVLILFGGFLLRYVILTAGQLIH